MSDPRIPPRARADWDSAVLDAIATLTVTGANQAPPAPPAPAADSGSNQRPTANIVGILAWHPALMKSYFAFNNYLFHSTLSDRIRELVILGTAQVRRNEYVWVHHLGMAREAGISETEIDVLSKPLDPSQWKPFEATVLQAVEEICRDRHISDATWAALSTELDRQQLMDLVFTVGGYDLLSVAMNSFGLQLDEEAEGLAQEAHT